MTPPAVTNKSLERSSACLSLASCKSSCSKTGYVQVRFETEVSSSEEMNLNGPVFKVHDHKIGFLCLNKEATLLASASSQGTIIKIFNTLGRNLVTKLRRGKDPAKITHMSFSPTSEWLCVCSDKGTVHIFNVSDSSKTQKSSINFIGDLSILPSSLHDYVNSEFSFVQIHSVKPDSIAAFDEQVSNQVNVLSPDGSLTSYSFDVENGGEAQKQSCYIYLIC
nr:WD40 domain-containing protein [Cedratvirus duvanny]